jgi:hypothetical protein
MNLSQEDIFLIHALQHPLDARWQQTVITLCTPSLNWMRLFQRANAIGLGPVLYRQLSQVKGQLALPDDGMEFLKNIYLRNLAKNTYRGMELSRILKAFDDADIAVILLKGAALAEGVYHDPGARVYGDLDILVKKADLERSRDVLYRLNYDSDATVSAQEHYRKHHHHLAPMIHPENAVVVELHWNVDWRTNVDIDAWWKRSVPADIAGCRVRIMGWADLVLHLCLHLFSGGDTRKSLRGVYDIYRALQCAGSSMDWALFDAEAHRYGLAETVYPGLKTTRNLFDPGERRVVWPASLPADRAMVAQMESTVFGIDNRTSYPGSLIAIQAEKRLRKKILELWKRFFLNPTQMAMRYGVAESSWRVYLLYLFRPLQLFWRYGKYTRQFILPK